MKRALAIAAVVALAYVLYRNRAKLGFLVGSFGNQVKHDLSTATPVGPVTLPTPNTPSQPAQTPAALGRPAVSASTRLSPAVSGLKVTGAAPSPVRIPRIPSPVPPPHAVAPIKPNHPKVFQSPSGGKAPWRGDLS